MTAALFTSGCNGGGGAEPISDMGPEQTAAAGEAITFSGHSNARNYRSAADGGSAFAGGCTTTLPASPADVDGDDIPDELTVVTYTNCVEGGVTFSGTQTIQDDDTGSAGFQFTSAWTFDASGTVDGHSVTYGYDAALIGNGTTSGSFSLSDTASIEIDVSGPDVNGSISDDHAWSVVFTPDDGVWTPSAGLPLEAGDLTLSGALDSQVTIDGDGTLSLTGAVSTTETLRTASSCATSIVSGEVQVIVAEPEEGLLLVTWNGCGDTSAEFTGLLP